MSRETILRQYLDTLKGQYSHILIDCQPSLGMLTVNALAAANRITVVVGANMPDLASRDRERAALHLFRVLEYLGKGTLGQEL